jgi:hypothetical protein
LHNGIWLDMQEFPMLFEFKSRATGSVIMTGDVGKKVLPLIGKSPDPKGIITVSQMPAAIAALEAACAREKELAAAARNPAGRPASNAASPSDAAATQADKDDDDPHLIGISQRVFPLIEMLKAAHAGGKDITWGV